MNETFKKIDDIMFMLKCWSIKIGLFNNFKIKNKTNML